MRLMRNSELCNKTMDCGLISGHEDSCVPFKTIPKATCKKCGTTDFVFEQICNDCDLADTVEVRERIASNLFKPSAEVLLTEAKTLLDEAFKEIKSLEGGTTKLMTALSDSNESIRKLMEERDAVNTMLVKWSSEETISKELVAQTEEHFKLLVARKQGLH